VTEARPVEPSVAVPAPAQPVETQRTSAEASPLRASVAKGGWARVILGALFVAFVLRAFVVQAFWIPSESMENTLVYGDRVLVSKVSYRLHDVNRRDVVVFEKDAEQMRADPNGPSVLIKRVVAVGGDSLVIDDASSTVVVNGIVLVEPEVKSGAKIHNGPRRCVAAAPCVVPAGALFVMGDNRDRSADSRFIGYVRSDQVVGRAFVRVWPFSRLGGL